MNSDNGRLNFKATLDNSLLRTQATEASNILKNVSQSAVDGGAMIDRTFSTLGKTIAGAFSVKVAADFAQKVIAVRAEIESLEISFKTLLGSEEKAAEMFGQIKKFAVETPMQLKDLASAAQMMLSFNIEESMILPYLKALGDVSMGDTQRFQGLALAFSQMSSAGKLMGQDLMQMINAGFNPLAQMAEKTGKSLAQLKDEMASGKITAQMVQQAFIDATSAGGKYYGMLEAQSKGLRGSISNLQGAIDDMFNDIGTSSQGVVSGVVNTATTLVKNYRDVADAIFGIVASYGVYKAAVITNEAVNASVSSQVVASYAAEQEAINALLVQKQAEVATTVEVETADVKAAVAKGLLTQAQGEEVVMSRVALAQKRQAVVQAELQAKAELDAAVAAHTAAKEQLAAAQSNLYALEAETHALAAYATAQEQAAMATKLASAEKKVQAAAIAEKTAAEKVEAATTELTNATTTKNAIANGADAVAKGTNTVATNILTAATNALKSACIKLWATMAAHPLALVLGAVTALGYAIYALITHETDAEKTQREFNRTTAEGQAAIDAEQASIKTLFSVLKTAKEGTKEYEIAKERIISQYGRYLKGLIDEKNNLIDVAAAYERVAEAARNAASARALDKATKKAQDDYEKVLTDTNQEIMDTLRKKLSADDANTWMQIINKQFDKYGRLSKEMQGQLRRAMGIGRANDADAVAKILKLQAKQGAASKVYETQVSEANHMFGSSVNPYKELTRDQLNAAIDDLKAQLKDEKQTSYQVVAGGKVLTDNITSRAEATRRLTQLEAALSDEQSKATPITTTLAQETTKATKRLQEANATLKKMNANRSAYTQEQWDKAVEEQKAAKQAYDKLQMPTTNKGRGSYQSQSSLNRKAQEAANDFAETYERTLRQAKAKMNQQNIQYMDEGVKKTLAQSNADFDAQRQEWDDMLSDLAKARKRMAKETFAAEHGGKLDGWEKTKEGMLSQKEWEEKVKEENVEFAEKYAEALKNIEENRLREQTRINTEYNAELVRQYGTTEQKIEQLEAERIRQYNVLPQEFWIALDRQIDEEITKLKAANIAKKTWVPIVNDLKKTGEAGIIALMQHLDEMTTEGIEEAIRKLKEMRQEAEKALDVEKYKKITDAINKLQDKQNERNNKNRKKEGFWGLIDAFKEIRDKQKRINELKKEQKRLDDMAKQQAAEIAKKEEEITKWVKERTGEDVSSDELGSSDTEGLFDNNEADKEAYKGKMSQLNEMKEGLTAIKGEAQAAGEEMKGLSSGGEGGDGGEGYMVMIDKIVHGINDAVHGFAALGNELLDTMEALGNYSGPDSRLGKFSSFMNTFAAASQGATDAWEAYKSGNIGGMIDGVVRSWTEWFKGFAAAHDAIREERIENYQREIDALKWSLENMDALRIADEIGDAYDVVSGTLRGWVSIMSAYSNYSAQNNLISEAIVSSKILNVVAEKLADTYANIAYTADKALGDDRYRQARKEIENLAAQQVMLQQSIEAEYDKKNTDYDRIEDWKREMNENVKQMAEAINSLLEEIIGYSATDLATELGEAFIEAAKTGEDAMEAWGKRVDEIVADVVRKMLIQKYLEEDIGKILDKYKTRWFGTDGSFKGGIQGVIDSMDSFKADLNAVGDRFNQIWSSLPEDTKAIFDATREAQQRGIATASQDSVDELNARMTTIQSHTYALVENTKILTTTAGRILESVVNIDRNTDGLTNRVATVENYVKDMRNTLNDISLQGVKIK